MAKILYQHLSRENAENALLHPIVQEIRKTMDDPVPIVCIRYFTHGFCRNGEFL